MSKLDELIKELCPDGVEYVKLDCILVNNNAQNNISKKHYEEVGEIPIIDQSQSYVSGFTNDLSAVPPKLPCIIFGDHTRIVKYADFQFAQGASGTKVFVPKTSKINTKYIYYNFSNLDIPSRGYNRHWSIVKEMIIPLPPLPVQEEIVRILDNFTELTAELTAELTSRKKQYEYYRDELLTFGDEVEWKTLEEVCINTNNIRWAENEEKELKYIDLSSVNRDDNLIYETNFINYENAPSRAQQIVLSNDIIFGTTRPMLKRYSYITREYNEQICSTGFCILRANGKVVLPKWIFYQISSSAFYLHVEKYERGASYPAITNANVKLFKVPLPPLAEQQRIIDILDRFDALVNDISIGLPAEIEARQKQYEYYRDKLLTFKEV